ncbi:hypothetical protein ACFO5O_09865 [Geojedonia litorea]|uniref:Uncharacterized protein n=1 Tax=Geojedonia litorea TaxID=1268269 RepID=A0ABV9N7R0_9FLAO
MKSVSPIYPIYKNSPPVFTVHRSVYPIVPYSQAEKLTKKLVVLGIKAKFVTIPIGKHVKFTKDEKKMWDFLKELGL